MSEGGPVSHEEFSTMLNRIMSTFVGLSAQANELIQVREQVNQLTQRLNALENEGTGLRANLAETWEAVRRTEQERDSANQELFNAQQVVAEQRDTIEARNARIVVLEGELGTAVRNNHQLTGDLNASNQNYQQAKDTAEYWQRRHVELSKMYDDMTAQSAARLNRIQELDLEVASLKGQLAKIGEILASVVPASVVAQVA